MLLEEAIALRGVDAVLTSATDGDEALELLRAGDPRPDLVLLDLNMPRRHGREVLTEVKQDPELRSIPVVVFSTSSSPADIQDCRARDANSYVVKPLDFEGLYELIGEIDAWWEQQAGLPGAFR